MDENNKNVFETYNQSVTKKLVNKKRMLTEKQAFQLHQAIRNMKNVKAKSTIDIMEDVSDIIMFGTLLIYSVAT